MNKAKKLAAACTTQKEQIPAVPDNVPGWNIEPLGQYRSGGINKALIALNLKNFIYVIEYGSVGVYFAYVYDKYKNVFYTIIPHALINFTATIILSFR